MRRQTRTVGEVLGHAERNPSELLTINRLYRRQIRIAWLRYLVGQFMVWGWGLVIAFGLLMELPAVARIVP